MSRKIKPKEWKPTGLREERIENEDYIIEVIDGTINKRKKPKKENKYSKLPKQYKTKEERELEEKLERFNLKDDEKGNSLSTIDTTKFI